MTLTLSKVQSYTHLLSLSLSLRSLPLLEGGAGHRSGTCSRWPSSKRLAAKPRRSALPTPCRVWCPQVGQRRVAWRIVCAAEQEEQAETASASSTPQTPHVTVCECCSRAFCECLLPLSALCRSRLAQAKGNHMTTASARGYRKKAPVIPARAGGGVSCS